MRQSLIHHLLALLVVWAFANDAWAAITPEPSDDAVAAEDNVFLSVSENAGGTALADQGSPPPAVPAETSQPARPAFPSRPVPVRPGNCLLVYLLMTLRR
jgi:hypothetical protein